MQHLTYLEGKWLTTLIKDMQHIGCKIQLHDLRMPTLQRENDTFIMDAIINNPYMEDRHWEISNWCRIYTKA
eukprot:6736004-Ditylum_brightwellii.AAC.1